MNLEIKTIELLKELINEYESKKIDQDYFVKIIEILNRDQLFMNILSLEFSNKRIVVPGHMKKENIGKISIDFNCFFKYLSKNTSEFINIVNLNKLKLYFGMQYILHECSHVLQRMWAYENKNLHDEVNMIYKKMIDTMNHSKYVRIIYHFNSSNFFFERDANLMSFNVLKDIWREDFQIYHINCEYYLNNMFDIYDVIGHKTPIEITYDLIKEKEIVDVNNLTFEELIIQGFWLDEEQWETFENIYKIYTKPYEAITIEKEVLRRIREL